VVLLTNLNVTAKQNRADQVINDYPNTVCSGGTCIMVEMTSVVFL